MNFKLLKEDIRLYFQAKNQDFQDFLNHSILGEKPLKPSYFPEKVKISWRFSPETRTFSATWKEHPEYFSVSETVEGVITNMNDLICEHFEVSRYEIRKFGKNYFCPPKEAYKEMLKLERNRKKLTAFKQTTEFQRVPRLGLAVTK